MREKRQSQRTETAVPHTRKGIWELFATKFSPNLPLGLFAASDWILHQPRDLKSPPS
ncbi:unnamed protein product [Arabidopsis lyrata]|nr:unnamed protein product [Arabidopsis lyrata]